MPIRGLLRSAFIIGAVWALWHYAPLLRINRPLMWIAWLTLGTLAMRLILVCLYVRCGYTIWIPAAFHFADNICWQLQQARGIAFHPEVHAIAMIVMAIAIWMLVSDREERIPGD